MPLTRQHIKGERPVRQRRLNEGVVMERIMEQKQFSIDWEEA